MKTFADIAEMKSHLKENQFLWKEPDGLLIPTEPDPDERNNIRNRIQAALDMLDWVTDS